MSGLIERQAAIDALNDEFTITGKTNAVIVQDYIRRVNNRLHDLPSAQPEKCSDILEELKDDDYYNYIHTGYSSFSEDDWDYLIRKAKEKEELHERLNIKASGD